MAASRSNESEDVEKSDEGDLELIVKHPLHNTWTLWYYDNDRKKQWEENLKEITSFNTVEDFWSVFNHIKAASELKQGCDYSLFKKGIRPMWEDPANKRGGRWLINLEKKNREHELDHYWLEILLCMIGEAFEEHSDGVCGATINIRNKGDKIGVWTSDADRSNEETVLAIGRKLKERLNIPPRQLIGYQVHADSQTKSGSVTKNSFCV